MTKSHDQNAKNPQDLPFLIYRSGSWTLKRNVPKKYFPVEDRRQIWKSIRAPDGLAAQREAEAIWRSMLAEWDRKLIEADTLKDPDQVVAMRVARKAGFDYLIVSEVAKLPTQEILKRIQYVAAHSSGWPNMNLAAAVLGGVRAPRRVSDIYEAHQKFVHAEYNRKSASQLHQAQIADWSVVQKLIKYFGDVDVTRLDFNDVRRMYMDVWRNERLPPLKISTLNGRLYRLQGIFSNAEYILKFKMPFSFSDASVRDIWRTERPAYSQKWLQEKFLGQSALAGLPDAERFLLLGMVNTGYRLMEGANLSAEEIVLDHQIPHLNFLGKFRPLKTPAAYRLVPLTGISLEAFKAFPKGFPSLRDDMALSGRLNRFLTRAGLRETPRHTVHSLRHSFSSRLAHAGVHEDLIAELMGHSLRRGYGRGSPLELRIRAVEKICLQNRKGLYFEGKS